MPCCIIVADGSAVVFQQPARDLGQGEYVDCKALMAKVEKQDPQRIVLREVLKRTT
jgi:hypothetical protein